MKTHMILAALLICISAAAAKDKTPVPEENNARWIRHASISPDGKTVAFAYQGDIFTVPSSGGNAKQLTTNPAHDTDPFWTEDGKHIVFCSYRELSKDIWIIPAEGGAPKQLTTYPGKEKILTVSGGQVYFSAAMQAIPGYADFPGEASVYKVSLEGGNPVLVSPLNIASLSIKGDNIIYEDIKGYEDELRKHHTSSVTRDIWLWSKTKKHGKKIETYTKLSNFKGEDRNPVFAADGDKFWYLSESSGSFNVWKSSISNPNSQIQLTDLKTHPVRSLSASNNGLLLFSYNGDLYTCNEGSQPKKLKVNVVKDNAKRDVIRRSISGGITSFCVSPNEKEIAVIAHGDVFVCSIDFKSTRRITNTPTQERGICFSEDGRTIFYGAERDGEWGIWKTTLSNKDDKYLSLSFNTTESRFTPKGQTCFQPAVSPDGKWVAYLRDRTEIVIQDADGNKQKSLLKGVNYSYRDGDLEFEWSPDSKHILTIYQGEGGWHNTDIALIDIEKGSVTNLTQSGYSDWDFRWGMKGAAMTWVSDKYGYRSHGSWGSDDDIYVMFFDKTAFRKFSQDSDAVEIEKAIASVKEKKDTSAKKEEKAIKINLDGKEDRIVRLTKTSGSIRGGWLNDEGTKMYYVSYGEKGGELMCLDIKKKTSKSIAKVRSGFDVGKSGKALYALTGSGVTKISIPDGKETEIDFDSEYDYQPAKEREYIFYHAWKQVDEKFYDPDIHGLDWKAMRDNYAQFLPFINNNFDFQELLSELLGELNASHTGGRYYFRGEKNVGRLGVIFKDVKKGIEIEEILPGSVLAIEVPELEPGDLILAVDGVSTEGKTWYDALEGKAGKRIQLTIKRGSKTEEVYVKAKYSDSEALYKRWVRHNEEIVEKLSGGKVGYVHIEGMDSESFRELYSKALGKYRSAQALIVDTRHNGGGWLHDDLVSFLGGKKYIEFRPRGQYIGDDPFNKWTKPSCVLIGEDNYSDACGFPYAYKTLGIGKLIGAPVPGTMTAVWWERQIDNTLIFGIPQVTSWGLNENRPLENYQIEPDILVYNDPASLIQGKDKQLEKAVEEMMKEIAE